MPKSREEGAVSASEVESRTRKRPTFCLGGCMHVTEGVDAWLLLCRVFLFNAITSFNFSAFGFLYIEYSSHFHATRAEIGWIAAIQLVVQSLIAPLFSPFIETWGCAWIASIGSFLLSGGWFSGSFAPNIWTLYVTQGIVGGVGLSMTNMASSIIVQYNFSKSRSFANGISMLGWSCGYIVGPALTEALISQYGWRGASVVLSGVLLHRVPLGMTFWTIQKSVSFSGKKPQCSFTFAFFKHPTFALLWWSEIFNKMFMMAYGNHLPSYTLYRNLSVKDATSFATTMYISNTASRVLVTILSNFMSRILLYSIGCALGAVSVIVMILPENYAGLMSSAVFAGADIGISNALPTVILVDFLGVENLAHSLGLLSVAVGLGSLTATPLAGFIYDMTLNYDLSFIVMGAAVGAGAVASGLAWLLHKPTVFEKQKLDAENLSTA